MRERDERGERGGRRWVEDGGKEREGGEDGKRREGKGVTKSKSTYKSKCKG